MKSTTGLIHLASNFSQLKKYWIIALILLGNYSAYNQIGPINHLTYSSAFNYATADLDNDGDLDVISAKHRVTPLDRAIIWFENIDGQGTDWILHEIDFPNDAQNYGQIAAVDVTGDGWADIITSTSYTLVNNGNTSNVSFTPVLNNMPPSRQMRLGDFDNDGDLDVLRWLIDGNIIKYQNTQLDGTFSSPTEIPLLPSIPFQRIRDTKVIDVDLDNDLDLVSTISSETSDSTFLVWYENIDGLGNFGLPHMINISTNTTLLNHSFISVGDFNGDGTIDVVNSRSSSIKIYTQQNNIWELQFEELGEYGRHVETADFDNDGDLDFIEGRNYGEDCHWFENVDNSGVFNKIPLIDTFPLEGVLHFILDDFDSDNDIDISLVNSASGKDGFFLFKNELNNTGNFSDPIQISDNINGPLVPYSTDLDNDSDIDVLIYSPVDQNIYWSENLNNSDQFSLPIPLIDDETLSNAIFKDLDSDGDQDVIAISNYELVWFENQSNNSIVQFGEKQILAVENLSSNSLIAGDFDSDGDIDISASTLTEKQAFWFEQQSSNTFISHLVSPDSIETIYGFGDLNNDGLKDIVYLKTSQTNNLSSLCFFKQEVDGSFSSILLNEGSTPLNVIITDIDNDLDDDLLIRTFNFNQGIYLLVNTPNGLTEVIVNLDLDVNDHFKVSHLKVADLDYDGKKDIYSGKYWYRQLPELTFSNKLTLDNGIPFGSLDFNDLNEDGIKDFIYSAHGEDVIVWAENQIPDLSFIEGRVAIDQNLDCMLELGIDTTDLYGWIIEFNRADTSYYSSTNIEGYYTVGLPDSGEYTVQLHFPNNYWGACYEDTLLTVNSNQISILDFQVQPEFDCPLMQIDMGNAHLRPCIDGNINIQYCNEGTVSADNAQVEVIIDDLLGFNDVNFPYTTTDSSYIFDIGEVDVFECGNIQISVTPDCDSAQVGQIVCNTAYVTPDSLCAPLDSLWDGSTIEVNGLCVNDSIQFELKNIGIGAMSEARMFRIEIVNDDIVLMIVADTFQLDPEETKWFTMDSEMEIIRLEADQDENHPVLSTASTIVEECSDFEITLNLLPNNNGNLFNVTRCHFITGSYDPNIKEVIPKGYGTENYIDENWELDYTIHFQNTGNDTAFTVVVKDPISEQLDLSTLRVGGGSHPFTWELTTQRELIFTFNNILLPDSTTNEVASHGYFQFSISPNEDIPFGTLIQNRAAIYFDFNDPIITNQVSQTIRTPIFANSEHVDICVEDFFMDIQILEDVLLVDSTLTAEGLFLDFYHVHAQDPVFTNVDTMVTVGEIFQGIEITQDTIIEIVLQSSIGCDSIVVTNISTIVNTSDLENQYGFNAFPVPTEDEVLLSWNANNPSPTALSLIAADGQKLKSIDLKDHSDSSFSIDLGSFARGVYWVRIDLESGTVYRRLVKI